jgi:hypothetical protein
MKSNWIIGLSWLLVLGAACAAEEAPRADSHGGGGPGGSAGAAGGSGSASSWSDPYPDLPAANDPAIARADCGSRVSGEFIGPGGIRYHITAPPRQDSSKMPLLVQNHSDHCGTGDPGFVTLTVSDPNPPNGEDHSSPPNGEDQSEMHGSGCSPYCSTFKLLGASGLEDLLLDAATKVRFDHKRVFMIGAGQCTDPVTFALETELQPFFAGVVCEAHTEWQMSECPAVSAAKRTPLSPRVFFSVGGCDHSFCPQMACYESVKAGGYDVTIKQETTYDACPCDSFDFAKRPHVLDGSDRLDDAASWMDATSR